MTTIQERLRAGSRRFIDYIFKDPYNGPPVISIPAMPDNIDMLLNEAASEIDRLEDKIEELKRILEVYQHGD